MATPTKVRIIATATKAGNGTNITLRVATLAADVEVNGLKSVKNRLKNKSETS